MFEFKFKRLLSFLMAFALIFASVPLIEAKAATLITTAEQLAAISDDLSGDYVLGNDIDLTGYLSGKEKGWTAIGTFKGTFDGNGKTISGLWSVNRGSNGLFSKIENATVKNLNVVLDDRGISGHTDWHYEGVGGVVGNAAGSSVIENVSVQGGTVSSSDDSAGGIVGSFTIDKKDFDKGIKGKISNVTVSGTKIYAKNWYGGGIIGYPESIDIDNAHVVNVDVSGGRYLGGVSGGGVNTTYKNSDATAVNVIGTEEYIGGFAGSLIYWYVTQDTIVDNCFVTFDQVSANGGSYAGGFAGEISGANVSNSNATGNRVYAKSNRGGGFVGWLREFHNDSAIVENCNATVNEVVLGNNYGGGFVGHMDDASSVINNCKAFVTDVTVKDLYGGGFAGAVDKGTITNSCATADVNGYRYIGGFIGHIDHKSYVSHAIALGNATARSSHVGGFAGRLDGKSVVDVSCAYGNAWSKGGRVGGFAGEANEGASITNAYARGNVNGKSHVGGFVGEVSKSLTVQNTYSSGVVMGSRDGTSGAFAGGKYITFQGNSYFDSDTSNRQNVIGTSGDIKGTPPTSQNTDEMTRQDTFAGWDFNGIWVIEENVTYPYFGFCDCIPEANLERTVVPTIDEISNVDTVITGSGIPGATIVVTFADGTKEAVEVGDDGNWYVVVLDSVVLTSGDTVSATQREKTKLVSDKVEQIVGDGDIDFTSLKVMKDWTVNGDEMTVTVTVENQSSSFTWNSVILNEYLSKKVTFVEGSNSNGNYDDDDHMIEVDFDAMAPGDKETLTYSVTVNPDAEIGDDLDSITRVIGN